MRPSRLHDATQTSAGFAAAEPRQRVGGKQRPVAAVVAEESERLESELAEQAVGDLEEIESLEPERAAELIMAARAHWFENEQQA